MGFPSFHHSAVFYVNFGCLKFRSILTSEYGFSFCQRRVSLLLLPKSYESSFRPFFVKA